MKSIKLHSVLAPKQTVKFATFYRSSTPITSFTLKATERHPKLSLINKNTARYATTERNNNNGPIPLPPSSGSEKNVKVLQPGESISFEELGPIVIREDGSMGRLETWNELTEHEKENIMRVLPLRNQQRREKLLREQQEQLQSVIDDSSLLLKDSEKNVRNDLNIKFTGNEKKEDFVIREQLTMYEQQSAHENQIPVDLSDHPTCASFVMRLGRLNHVAIAVPDLEQATSIYRDILNADCSEPLDLPEHGVTTVFVNLGNTKLELLSILGDKSPIANFLQKNPKGGIHHICIEVKDIRKALVHIEKAGIVVLDKEPRIGAHGKPVVFVHPKSMGGVLLELEQE